MRARMQARRQWPHHPPSQSSRYTSHQRSHHPSVRATTTRSRNAQAFTRARLLARSFNTHFLCDSRGPTGRLLHAYDRRSSSEAATATRESGVAEQCATADARTARAADQGEARSLAKRTWSPIRPLSCAFEVRASPVMGRRLIVEGGILDDDPGALP